MYLTGMLPVSLLRFEVIRRAPLILGSLIGILMGILIGGPYWGSLLGILIGDPHICLGSLLGILEDAGVLEDDAALQTKKNTS